MSHIQLTAGVIKNKDGQDARAVACFDVPLVWNVFDASSGEVEKDKSPLSIEEWIIHSPDGRTLGWHPLRVEFVPILNCSVGFGGFCRWVANLPEHEFIELQDSHISRRVNRVLTTMFVGDDPFIAGIRVQEIRGAQILLGRDEHMKLGFRSSVIGWGEAAPDELKKRIRTAIFYSDVHGLPCAEGDLTLIAAEIAAMQNEEPVVPDARGLIWPTQEHIHRGA